MKKIISIFLAMTMVFSFAGCGKTRKADDAFYEIYKGALENEYIYYSVYDIDKNGVAEIITYTDGKTFDTASYSYKCMVYTVDKNSLVYVGEFQTKDMIYGSENEGIWGCGSASGGEEFRHYKMSEGTLADGEKSLRTYNDGEINYLINENPSSEQEYSEIRNGLFPIEMYDDKATIDELKNDTEQIGEVIGYTVYSDVVTKINGCDVPSYSVDGRAVVATEDLRDFGFDDVFDEASRSINVTRNYDKTEVTAYYEASKVSPSVIGKRALNILRTDIITYIAGQPVTGYNVDGKTMIYFEDLATFGGISYDESARVLNLSMEWLSDAKYREYVDRRHRITLETSSEGGYIRANLDDSELWVKTVYEGEGALSDAYKAGDTVYYGTHDGFYAIDLNTGETKWNVALEASGIIAFDYDDEKVTALIAHSGGVRHIAVSIEGELLYDGNYTDEDGTGMNLPDAFYDLGGNIAVLQYTDAAGAGINMWQKVNIGG